MLYALMLPLVLGALVGDSSAAVAHTPAKISPEILRELKDFVDLIPAAVVDELIAKHYIIDPNFREAVKYLRSSQFGQLLERVQQVPEIVELMTYLHLLADANTNAANTNDNEPYSCQPPCPRYSAQDRAAAVAGLPPPDMEWEIVLMTKAQLPPHLKDNATPLMPPHVTDFRSFSGFVEELVDHLPRDEYVQMIKQKRQKSAAFAKFYRALRSVDLRSMVNVALRAPSVVEVLKPLAAHGIDVKALEQTAFKVISWGPV